MIGHLSSNVRVSVVCWMGAYLSLGVSGVVGGSGVACWAFAVLRSECVR